MKLPPLDSLPAIEEEHARRMFLQAQGLLDPFPSVEEAVRSCLCIQTQYSQSLAVATAARAKPQPPSFFDKALDIAGPLRKTWTVRWTMHTVHEDDAILHASSAGRHLHRRFVKGHLEHFKITEDELRKREDRIWNVLMAHGPLTRQQLHEHVPEYKGMPGAGWGWDVAGLAFEGRLYLCSHMGATTFVGVQQPELIPEAEAQALLLERYLRAHGLATRKDFKIWSSLYMPAVDGAFRQLEDRIEWVRIEGRPEPYAKLRETPEPAAEPKPKLLAKFDPLVMAHWNRSLILEPEHYTKVIRPAGQIEATVLVRGRIAGTWRAERAGRRLLVTIDSFSSFGKRAAAALEKEADKVRISMGAEKLEVDFEAR